MQFVGGELMIRLVTITPDNWRFGLSVREDQYDYVSDSSGILARAYAYRDNRSQAFVIYDDNVPVGMAMYHDLDDWKRMTLVSSLSIIVIKEKDTG